MINNDNNNYDNDNYDNDSSDDITTTTEELILDHKKLTSRLMYFIDNQIRVLKNDSSALLSALVYCSMRVENTLKILLNENKKEIDEFVDSCVIFALSKSKQAIQSFFIKHNPFNESLLTIAAAFPSSPFLHDNRNIKKKFLISKISCDSDYIKNNLNRKNNMQSFNRRPNKGC